MSAVRDDDAGTFMVSAGDMILAYHHKTGKLATLNTKDFSRLKVGIGPQPNIPSEAFVLQKFSDDELKGLKSVLDKSVESIQYYFKNGIAKTQNIYN